MNQDQDTNIEAKNLMQKMVDKWVDSVHSGQVIDQTDIDDFQKLLTDAYDYIDFYSSDWSGFGFTDEFPFSAISLQGCIDNCEGLEDEEVCDAFRWGMDEYDYIFFFLREVIATDGRSAWILVHSMSMGQGGVVQNMQDVFTTPLAAEISLRADGYIFIGDTPSGKADSFTDEQIFELVRKADK
jgi:hypothetical protein